ncbi:MAG: hypothetical protein VX792_01465 [Candidatus Latescibacterota bacterium]|jgi:hypothetical protein|nr:hypothetical protein [Candidatus Latescibacterota bacterium]
MRDTLFHDAMQFAETLTADVLEASRVYPGQSVAGYGPNATGGTLIRPGGRDCYPSYWIRDFAMSLECGLVSPAEMEHALLLTASRQQNIDWHTPSGSLVPRGAIADHITFDGKPIFFPGSMDYDKQGQPWGYYPSLDDHFFFVDIAWQLINQGNRLDILDAVIEGMTLLDRLDLAFAVPSADADTQLVYCDEEKRGVSFGFTDIVVHTGYLLFCSLLRFRAAKQLAQMHQLRGAQQQAQAYDAIAQTAATSIRSTFALENGLLKASTGKSAQVDVWGSAFAVYCGLWDREDGQRTCSALAHALSQGTIAWRGNIRHVPTDGDHSAESAWEQVVGQWPKNHYQNGAYWNTPTGWVCYSVAQVDQRAALQLATEYVDQLREDDFRQGAEFGAPYECIHPQGDHRQNPVYLTSMTCPLAAFKRLGWLVD